VNSSSTAARRAAGSVSFHTATYFSTTASKSLMSVPFVVVSGGTTVARSG
jgi:hypothetical protein